jgi:protein O-GlcNAc transferase
MLGHFMPRAFVWFCCCVLLPVAWTVAFAQSSRLKECTRVLYRGEYAQAAQLAEKYLRQHPKDVPARILLGRAELAQGQFVPALENLRKALAIDPRNIDALYYLSFAARARADQEYQRLFAMNPDSGRVHQLLAEAALASENPTQAEAEFGKALAANPRSAEVATELGELKRSQSKFDEAISYYTQASQVSSLNYDIAYGLGACYTYKQDYATAIEWLRKALRFDPQSAAGHFALGNALFQSGQVEGSIPELRSALWLEPRMKQGFFLLGRAYSKLGRRDEAAAAFKKLDELSGSGGSGPGNVPHGADSKRAIPQE